MCLYLTLYLTQNFHLYSCVEVTDVPLFLSYFGRYFITCTFHLFFIFQYFSVFDDFYSFLFVFVFF